MTQADLLNLEQRIKIEINKEQTELRHEDRKKSSVYFFKVDELEKTSAVTSNILSNMADNFAELKEMVKEWFKETNNKIDSFPDRFATKQEHKENVSQIEKLSKALEGINLKIAMVSGGFVVFMFIVNFVIQKMMK